MSVSVRNESSGPFVVGVGIKRQTIVPGGVATLTDEEWSGVPSFKKGPGLLNPLYPSSGDYSNAMMKFDYFTVSGQNELRYLGKADEQALDTDDMWTISQYDYVDLGAGDVRVSRIQVLDSVAWQDRATLAWTP